ncbi:TetR/AcrR family transcriptional regulator [Embleya sp. NPDC059237]|uniref:TetR/AcrR family transcriptional regulator n=1 Tax=Embleya sp. NPDC059237 TaxID=3346784 RepID=UPI0036C7A033
MASAPDRPGTHEPPGHDAPPVRRRGRALEQAIYQAVFDQLLEVGYAGLTMDGVAAAAGTGKAPLYRRWSDKQALLSDALRDRLPNADDVEIVGDLRCDLLAVLRFMFSACTVTGDPALQLAKAEADATHDVVRARVSAPARQMMLDVLRAGEARGEVRPGAATPLIARVGIAVVVYQNLTGRDGLDDAFIEQVVDEVLLPLVRNPDGPAPG